MHKHTRMHTYVGMYVCTHMNMNGCIHSQWMRACRLICAYACICVCRRPNGYTSVCCLMSEVWMSTQKPSCKILVDSLCTCSFACLHSWLPVSFLSACLCLYVCAYVIHRYGWMDGWTDGRMDGWNYRYVYVGM